MLHSSTRMFRLPSSRLLVWQVFCWLLSEPLATENFRLHHTKLGSLGDLWAAAAVAREDTSACLRGYYQTPVHIENGHVDPILMPVLNLINYENFIAPPISLKNNGYTVKLVPGEYSKTSNYNIPKLTGGFLGNREYRLESLHFHWGTENNEGSEHVINHVRYPLEMHIIHRNSNYSDWDEAVKHRDGVVVLAFLFQLQTKDNHRYKAIIDKLDQVRTEGNQVYLDRSFPLSILLPGSKDSFFTYQGSLSTPPCSEAVVWFVFPETIPISFRQMQRFRHLFIRKNYRNLQPLGRRRIFYRHHQRFLSNVDMLNYYKTTISLEDFLQD